MFNFFHIKMMKISFEIIRYHCFVLVTMRHLHTCVCFVHVRLHKNKSLIQQNLAYTTNQNLYNKPYAAKAKTVELTEAFIKAFSGVFTAQSSI